MTDGAALLQNILENRADDTARLVYADWLQENGEPERAEYIRACIKLWNIQKETQTPEHIALARRIKELLDENPLAPGWREPWPGARLDPSVGMYSQRGFWGTLVCPSRTWMANADRALAWCPVEKVHFTDRPMFYWSDGHVILDDDPEVRELEVHSMPVAPRDPLRTLCEQRWPGVAFDVPGTPVVNWDAPADPQPSIRSILHAAFDKAIQQLILGSNSLPHIYQPGYPKTTS